MAPTKIPSEQLAIKIQNNGTPITPRTNINIVGGEVTDDPDNDAVKITFAQPTQVVLTATYYR